LSGAPRAETRRWTDHLIKNRARTTSTSNRDFLDFPRPSNNFAPAMLVFRRVKYED
jgi:hypothetical protein